MAIKNTITVGQVSDSLGGFRVQAERRKDTFTVSSRLGDHAFLTLQQLKDRVNAQDYMIVDTVNTEVNRMVTFKV